VAVDGKPPVTQIRAPMDLRAVASRIDAIRERLGKLDAEVNRLGSVADASAVGSQVNALTRSLIALQQRVSALELAIGAADTIVLAASSAIERFDVVVPSVPNQCRTADPNDRTMVHAAIGIALNAASTGSPVTIQRGGPLTLPISTLEAGRAVYAGISGEVTQDTSACAIVIPVGVATSTSAIWVSAELALLNQIDLYGDAFDASMPITLALLEAQIGDLAALITSGENGFLYVYQGQLILNDGGDGGGAVDSVNGQTGVVELALNDLIDVDTDDATPGDMLVLESSTWRSRRVAGITFTFSDTAPADPTAGDRWYNPDDGIQYTWIEDGSSSQWVEV
jgi:hypothetical protein